MTPGRRYRRVLVRFRRLTKNRHTILLSLAVVVGGLGGLAAIAFRELVRLVQWIGYGIPDDTMITDAASLPWWQLLLVPAAGGLVVGLMVRFLMPERRPEAVADVIAASTIRNGEIGWRNGFFAALVSATSIGAGASVGREGPVVHLAAAIASQISQKLDLGRSLTITLLGCGVASGVAASFNAPIAGVFFAIEVVVGHYALGAVGPVVIASVVGTLISRAFYGNYPAFTVPSFEIVSVWEFPAFALLGIVAGVAAMAMMRSLIVAEGLWRRLPVPRWSHAAGAGLMVGAVGLWLPEILGVGYAATDAALNEQVALHMLIILALAKIVMTAICLGAGFGGGVFSPSLFLGAMTGGAFGIIATYAFPELSSGYGAYTMVGMGAVAGAVLGAPISTILIIFELTGDYALTIAVMVATVLATVITQSFSYRSFFEWQLELRGYSLKGGRASRLLRSTTVADVMRRSSPKVAPEAGVETVHDRLLHTHSGVVFIVDAEERLRGVVTLADLAHAAYDEDATGASTAQEMATRAPAVLHPDDTLETAMNVMNNTDETLLPVVDDGDPPQLLGSVEQRDVTRRYTALLLQARREERGE